jgi:hypothetical protein
MSEYNLELFGPYTPFIDNYILQLIAQASDGEVDLTELAFSDNKKFRYAEIYNANSNAYVAYILARLGFDSTLVTTNSNMIRVAILSCVFTLNIVAKLQGQFDIVKYPCPYDWNTATYISLGRPKVICYKGVVPAGYKKEDIDQQWMLIYASDLLDDNEEIMTIGFPEDTATFKEQFNDIVKRDVAYKLAECSNFEYANTLLDAYHSYVPIFSHTKLNIQVADLIDRNKYDDYHFTSASLVQTAEGYLLAQRMVNYTIVPDTLTYIVADKENRVFSKTLLLNFDKNWQLLNTRLLQDYPLKHLSWANNLEDVRLYAEDAFIATSLNELPEQVCRMVLGKFDNNGKVISRRVQESINSNNEKNWLPYYDKKLYMIYNFDPFIILTMDDEKVINKQEYTLRKCWRGSAAPILFTHDNKNGILCIIHQVLVEQNPLNRYYYNRWVFLVGASNDFTEIYYSDVWKYSKQNVEFCIGLCSSYNPDELIVTYSELDCTANYASVQRNDVSSSLIFHETLTKK